MLSIQAECKIIADLFSNISPKYVIKVIDEPRFVSMWDILLIVAGWETSLKLEILLAKIKGGVQEYAQRVYIGILDTSSRVQPIRRVFHRGRASGHRTISCTPTVWFGYSLESWDLSQRTQIQCQWLVSPVNKSFKSHRGVLHNESCGDEETDISVRSRNERVTLFTRGQRSLSSTTPLSTSNDFVLDTGSTLHICKYTHMCTSLFLKKTQRDSTSLILEVWRLSQNAATPVTRESSVEAK